MITKDESKSNKKEIVKKNNGKPEIKKRNG
jgi:hypothetical protein